MELKCTRSILSEYVSFSSNRTFMELKYDYMNGYPDKIEVLIVPLWN